MKIPDSKEVKCAHHAHRRSNTVNSTRLVGKVCLALLSALFVQSCQNVDKTVWMSYTHVANVRSFQAASTQYVGVDNGSFWALFDLCALDVQGSSLTGFDYNSAKFVAWSGSNSYGSAKWGLVNAGSGVTLRSDGGEVQNALWNAFKLGPATHYFSKQSYPVLKYRIAIFVKELPTGYQNGIMALGYEDSQIAPVMDNKSPGNPKSIPFYNSLGDPPIVGTCP